MGNFCIIRERLYSGGLAEGGRIDWCVGIDDRMRLSLRNFDIHRVRLRGLGLGLGLGSELGLGLGLGSEPAQLWGPQLHQTNLNPERQGIRGKLWSFKSARESIYSTLGSNYRACWSSNYSACWSSIYSTSERQWADYAFGFRWGWVITLPSDPFLSDDGQTNSRKPDAFPKSELEPDNNVQRQRSSWEHPDYKIIINSASYREKNKS